MIGSVLFSTLPTDLLPVLFSFLSCKELCCFDSAILNHTDRRIFLFALNQMFKRESKFVAMPALGLQSRARWYLCRRIPITNLSVLSVKCPEDMISMNSHSLKEISLMNAILGDKDALALSQCSNLKKLKCSNCSLPTHFDLGLILRNLTCLENLELGQIPFSRLTAEIISRHCQSLKFLDLFSVAGVGDEELRFLVQACPSLRSLRICRQANISEESVCMLMNSRPQIASIGICYCGGVSLASVLSLLREITIPTIFDLDGDEDLRISALKNLSSSILNFVSENPQISEFVSNDSLLNLLALKNRVRSKLISCFHEFAGNGYHCLVTVRVVPSLVHHCDSFNASELEFYLCLLEELSSHPGCKQHLLTSGVLSTFRLHRLELLMVSLYLFTLIANLVLGIFSSRESSRLPVSSHLSIIGSDRRLDQHSFFPHRQMLPKVSSRSASSDPFHLPGLHFSFPCAETCG
jgi:hypothetical protein